MASTETYPHTCVMYRLSVGALNGNFFLDKPRETTKKKRGAPHSLYLCRCFQRPSEGLVHDTLTRFFARRIPNLFAPFDYRRGRGGKP